MQRSSRPARIPSTQLLQDKHQPDLPPRRDLVHPVGIGEERAAERDEIGTPLLDRGDRGARIAEPPDRDHRDGNLALDAVGEAQERRRSRGHRRDHDGR